MQVLNQSLPVRMVLDNKDQMTNKFNVNVIFLFNGCVGNTLNYVTYFAFQVCLSLAVGFSDSTVDLVSS